MIDENIRNLLYYPLGFLPSLFFSSRFFIQWIRSEKAKKSYVDVDFWKLSIAGNAIALIHYFIQLQLIFVLVQSINAFIAWRNLDLIKNGGAKFSKKRLFCFFVSFIAAICALFSCHYFYSEAPEIAEKSVSFTWHAFGAIGSFVFASRFWVQWFYAEQNRKSTLNEEFWVLSLLGGLLTIIYALKIGDFVSTVNYTCGMIPYVRNLMLIRAAKDSKRATLPT